MTFGRKRLPSRAVIPALCRDLAFLYAVSADIAFAVGRLAVVQGGWVYILANRYRGALYIGVTTDVARRMWEHRNDLGSRHAARYGIDRLVWMERCEDIRDGIAREKSIKRWAREWKFNVIEERNPDWRDLSGEL